MTNEQFANMTETIIANKLDNALGVFTMSGTDEKCVPIGYVKIIVQESIRQALKASHDNN